MIIVEPLRGTSVTDLRVEVVERKGIGHPDTMCDAIMESVSVALSREYLASSDLHWRLSIWVSP